MNDDEGYYYDLATGDVVLGKKSPWNDRLGPYPTREAAAEALETARRRNAEWEIQRAAEWAEDHPDEDPPD